MKTGNIPVINIEGKNIPEAWEKAVLAVWDRGSKVKTQYDKSGDPPSCDATVIITVENPFAEPRIHKNIPGGPEELEVYRQEVVNGIHDHWIDPEAGKWTYTYHERLFDYSPCQDLSKSDSPRPFVAVDQIQYIIDYMAKSGHTRRAQAITWQPNCDPQTFDPPCLQRIWCRMMEDEQGGPVLNMNTHWRSRDLYKAWVMNVYALTDLQRVIAEKISEKIGRTVKVGRYVDISDSLHLYGSYFSEIESEVKKMKEKPIYIDFGDCNKCKSTVDLSGDYLKSIEENIERRTYKTTHPAFQMMTEEARANLKKDPDFYKKGDK